MAGGQVKYYDGVYQASFVGYFPADQPEYSCIVVIKTKPHAALHYGGQLAAPVFKEVATKLYAHYVQRKKTTPWQITADSSLRVYAGNAADVKKILTTINVPYSDSGNKSSWNVVYASYEKPVVKADEVAKNVVPDVRNMTLKDALYILENRDLKVAVKGHGKVVAQDVLPGTTIRDKQTITLLLN